MKLLGFLMLLAGWVIVFSAAALLKPPEARNAFVLAGLGVEVVGVVLVARSHVILRGERR